MLALPNMQTNHCPGFPFGRARPYDFRTLAASLICWRRLPDQIRQELLAVTVREEWEGALSSGDSRVLPGSGQDDDGAGRTTARR